MGTPRLRYPRVIAGYDRAYRLWCGLDRPAAAVPPALRVEIRRSYRTVRFAGGPVIQRGERVGMIHLDNARLSALHEKGRSPMTIGLEFRRLVIASLDALAERVRPGQPLAKVSAFMAVTIFHHGLQRLGFEPEPDGLVWPGLTAAYQRALLASRHPIGDFRLHRVASARAERLWISRDRLLARYGTAAARGGVARVAADVTTAQPRFG